MPILRITIGLTALSACTNVFPQSTDAARYINKQGVEVIQSRIVKNEESGVFSSGVIGIPNSNLSPPLPANDSKMHIRPRDQRVRDEDRLVILREELKKEATGFESKLRVVQTPALKAKLSPDELVRIELGLADHAQNVRSLNAEINRIALQPSS